MRAAAGPSGRVRAAERAWRRQRFGVLAGPVGGVLPPSRVRPVNPPCVRVNPLVNVSKVAPVALDWNSHQGEESR